jgi:protein-tyrosine phosphatase
MVGELGWPGGRNLRDLGGRALRTGATTVYGRVFRSAAPEYLTDEGWAVAKAAGVRTVVDLRNAPTETQRMADHPDVRAESLDGLALVSAPTEDPDDAEFLYAGRGWTIRARGSTTRGSPRLGSRQSCGPSPALRPACSSTAPAAGIAPA